MKNFSVRIVTACALSILCLTPMLVRAENIKKANEPVTLINHYGATLYVVVGRNAEVVPNLPSEFILFNSGQRSSKVVANGEEAYLRAEPIDDNKKYAFFGIDVEGSTTDIHGYESKGIAYSWNANTIIFCTPEDYAKNNSCF